MRHASGLNLVLVVFIGGCASPIEFGGGQADTSFQTVCGVSIPEETSRDTCKVVDYFEDGKKTRTELNFPDFGLLLVWQPGDKVQVFSDGADWGTRGYTTSEGETRFTIDRITYYYISDRSLAAREGAG